MTFYAGEFLSLPGLRAYWPMNAFDASGNTIDQAGLDLVLSYSGNPTYNYTTQGAGYIDLDGTGDFLSRGDEAALDILGTETSVASAVRGLTMGGYFWFDTLTTEMECLGKLNTAGNQRSYFLSKVASDKFTFTVSSNGTATTVVTSTTTALANAWYFVVGRYDPSTEINVFVQGSDDASNTTSIPAAIFNSTALFEIGSANSGGFGLLNGRASNCFLCGALLSDTAISNLYNNTKAAYGL